MPRNASGWLLAILSGYLPAAVLAGDVHRQGSARLSLVWEEGKLTSFVDRATRRDWIRTPAIPVQILVFGARAPLLAAGPPPRWVKTEAPDKQTLVQHYSFAFEGATLALRLTVSLRDADALWSVQWESSAPVPVAQVRAPYLAVPRALGDSSNDDFLAAPNWEGQVYRSPAEGDGPLFPNRGDSPGLTDEVSRPDEMRAHLGEYPGRFSAQFETLYDSQSGLLLWTPDSEGWTKQFRYDRTPEGPFMGVGHYVPGFGAKSYQQPYPAKTTAFRGDWYDAAGIYRSWALTQTWTSQKVERRDYAPMIREPFIFVNPQIRQWQPRTAESFAALVRAHSKLFDAPVLVNFFGWEKYGDWVAGDYYPPTGGEAYREGAALARKEGNRVFAFNSGHRFTVKTLPKRSIQADREERWTSMKEEMGAWWWDGTPNCLNMPWGVRNCMLNIGSPLVRKLMQDDFLEATRWGISVVQADQDMSLNLATSWKQPPGVPAGYGKLVSNLARQWFAEVRREGRKLDPEYSTGIERPNEFCLQEIDLYHHQPYRYGGGGFAQPVYAYLYHDFQTGYSGWTDVLGNFPGVDGRIHAVATAATWGQIIGVRMMFLEEDLKAGKPVTPFALSIREIVAFQRGEGNAFLLRGRMLPKPKLEGVSVLPELSRTGGWAYGISRLGESESVLSGSFQAPDGRVGTLLCNVTDKDTGIQLDPARWKKSGNYHLTRRLLGEAASTEVAVGPMAPVKVQLPAQRFVWLEWRARQ